MGRAIPFKKLITNLVIIASVFTSFTTVASAQSLDWINSPLSRQEEEVSHYIGPACTSQDIKRFSSVKNPVTNDFYDITGMCVQVGNQFSLATDGSRMYLKLGDDDVYRAINLSKYATIIPGSDGVLDRLYQGLYEPTELVAYKSFSKHVIANKSYDSGRVESYYINSPSEVYLKQGDHPLSGTPYQNVFSFAVSNNGRYVVAYADYANIIKIDLQTGNEYLVAKYGSEWYMSYSIPRAGAITDDGRYLYMSAIENLYDTANCGGSSDAGSIITLCPIRNFGDELSKTFSYASTQVRFSSDNLTLYMAANPVPGSYATSKMLTFSLKDAAIASKLDYLALGDSYSSGEGDTGKQANGSSFYLPSTDYKDGCHLSSRSYPFLIQSYLRIANERMKSIACSGARVKQDYTGDSSAYSGQGNRIINETIERQRAMKADALSNFTPGIVKQIDFVRDNKPAFVTLTGGGNDVGFAKILTYCALPSGAGEASNTCDEALPGKKQNSMLGDAITGQYDQTLKLIAALKAASNNTKIYIIGYPSFVSDEKNTCLNGAMLNKKERTMINMGVSYLNNILSHAAKVGGAYYIDIEKSLYGGRICEGSSLITGPLAVVGFDMNNHQNEMFHPNYLAHEAIAKTIFAAGISAEGVNPTPDPNATSPTKPDFFGNATYVRTTQEKLVSDGAIYAGKSILFSTSPGIFTANEIINFTIWSDEAKLGSLNTDAEGRVDGSLKLPPSIKPGYHMVMAEGRSPSGELTRVYQFVEVQGSSNDEDGDGITNDKDQCEFMAVWYDEQTGRDICNTSIQPGRPKASSTNSSSTNPSLASIGAANTGVIQPTQTGAVLGAHDNANIKQNNLHDVSSHNDMPARLMAGIGGVFTLLVILLVTNFVRRQTK